MGYKCKYCGVNLTHSTVCGACHAKLPLVRQLRKICDEIKGVKKPKYIQLDALNKALTKAYHTNLEDGRTEFACGLLLAKDIANGLPAVNESEVEGK